MMSGKRPLPDEIRTLAERLRTQDNRCTAEPLYCVEKKERVYGIDPGYAQDGDGFVWHSEDWDWIIESPEELLTELNLYVNRQDFPSAQCVHQHWDEHDDISFRDGTTLEGCHYAERWEFVTAHFTEAAAQEYIESNKHHFPLGARVFVTSQHRCYEWTAVREFLMQLADDEVPK